MSLIKKADVKNHLSTRHRTEIHLCQPEDQPTVAVAFEEGFVGAAPEFSDPAKEGLDTATSTGPETAPTVPVSDSNPAIVSTQSKSAKA
jgi:hypothetical protein